jgi:hypothetical protein
MDRRKQRSRPTSVASGAPVFRERLSERVDIDGSTQLRHLFAVEIRVRNVSSHGFMAECGVPVAIGSAVSLDVPGIGPVHAQVRWQIGNQMGGMFLDPISLRHCEWTATRADSVGESAAISAESPQPRA